MRLNEVVTPVKTVRKILPGVRYVIRDGVNVLQEHQEIIGYDNDNRLCYMNEEWVDVITAEEIK